jgi:Zn-dependent protease with chaperone function
MLMLFVRHIITNIRRKAFSRTIIICAIAIASGYLYLYVNISDLGGIWLTIFALATLLILVQLGFFVCSNRKSGEKITAARKEQEIQCMDEYSNFMRMAKEMGVEFMCPFLEVKGLKNVGFDVSKQQLVLGTDLWSQLTLEERNAIIAHEFAHAAKKHRIPNWQYCRRALWFLLAAFLLWMTTKFALDKTAFWFQFIFSLLMASSLLTMIFTITGHNNEYEADLVAADKTNTQVFISALEHIEDSPDRRDVEYITHPSVNKRISRLQRIPPN